VTGDITQSDLPASVRSGLREAIDILSGVEGIRFCYFTEADVVRHPLVQKIVRAYDARDAARRAARRPAEPVPTMPPAPAAPASASGATGTAPASVEPAPASASGATGTAPASVEPAAPDPFPSAPRPGAG
jgi:phosphate starvation-inducible PhoH-like protein